MKMKRPAEFDDEERKWKTGEFHALPVRERDPVPPEVLARDMVVIRWIFGIVIVVCLAIAAYKQLAQ